MWQISNSPWTGTAQPKAFVLWGWTKTRMLINVYSYAPHCPYHWKFSCPHQSESEWCKLITLFPEQLFSLMISSLQLMRFKNPVLHTPQPRSTSPVHIKDYILWFTNHLRLQLFISSGIPVNPPNPTASSPFLMCGPDHVTTPLNLTPRPQKVLRHLLTLLLFCHFTHLFMSYYCDWSIHLFTVHSFNKNVLSAYTEPGARLGPKECNGKKEKRRSPPVKLTIWGRR